MIVLTRLVSLSPVYLFSLIKNVFNSHQIMVLAVQREVINPTFLFNIPTRPIDRNFALGHMGTIVCFFYYINSDVMFGNIWDTAKVGSSDRGSGTKITARWSPPAKGAQWLPTQISWRLLAFYLLKLMGEMTSLIAN